MYIYTHTYTRTHTHRWIQAIKHTHAHTHTNTHTPTHTQVDPSHSASSSWVPQAQQTFEKSLSTEMLHCKHNGALIFQRSHLFRLNVNLYLSMVNI